MIVAVIVGVLMIVIVAVRFVAVRFVAVIVLIRVVRMRMRPVRPFHRLQDSLHRLTGVGAGRDDLNFEIFHVRRHLNDQCADVAADVQNDGTLTGVRVFLGSHNSPR